MAKGKFDLNDFRERIVQIKSTGAIREPTSNVPGLDLFSEVPGQLDSEGEIKCIQGMIDSMTPLERTFPSLIAGGLRRGQALFSVSTQAGPLSW